MVSSFPFLVLILGHVFSTKLDFEGFVQAQANPPKTSDTFHTSNLVAEP